MNCIRHITNLMVEFSIFQKYHDSITLNRPDEKETYIICPLSNESHTVGILSLNLGNVRSLYDRTFAQDKDRYNYVTENQSDEHLNIVPFLISLKTGKRILPVVISKDEQPIIAYGEPIAVKDGYDDGGHFDYHKIGEYMTMWQESVKKLQDESQKIKKKMVS